MRRKNLNKSSNSAILTEVLEIPEETCFDVFAKTVFRHHQRIWKPSTLKVNRSHLRNQILPSFRTKSVTEITRQDVQQWFTHLRAKPAAANRSLSILSLIMRQAETHGYRALNSNPCSRLRRYPCPGRERFLTFNEIYRLGSVLKTHESCFHLPITIIRLLLLTGCRQSEVRTLHWSEYREGHLYLRDSKIGPRTVWLSSTARSILDKLPRDSGWVFPANGKAAPMSVETLYRCWRIVRKEAKIPDVRLHDLRHSYASFALRKGETLLTIGRLLGHRDPSTTLKYTHFSDSMERNAVETIGKVLDVD